MFSLPRNVRIVNRSEWPDHLVRPLVAFVARRAGVTWAYEFTFKATSRNGCWMGRGGRRSGYAQMRRRCTHRWSGKDRRFSWSKTYDMPKSPVAMLVFLTAHEIYHSTPENREAFRFKRAMGERRNAAFGEHHCNEWAYKTMRAIAAEWPAFRAAIRKEIIESRTRRQRDLIANAPDVRRQKRIEQRRLLLKTWERKAKLAATKLRKLRRSLRGLEQKAAAPSCSPTDSTCAR